MTIFEILEHVTSEWCSAKCLCGWQRMCKAGRRHALPSDDISVGKYLHSRKKARKKLLCSLEVRQWILLYLLADSKTDISDT